MGLPLAGAGNTDATVAATVALAAAPAFEALSPELMCANGQLGPRLHVPLGKKRQGAFSLAAGAAFSFGLALGDAFGGGGFGAPLLPLPLPLFCLSPFGEPLPGPLVPGGCPLVLLPPFGVPLGGFPGVAGTVVSFAGAAAALAFDLAYAS